MDDRPDSLEMTMVATGFGYDPVWRARQAAVVARVLPQVRDIRRVGAAALDLAWTACGRFDAFYERGLNVVGHRRRCAGLRRGPGWRSASSPASGEDRGGA